MGTQVGTPPSVQFDMLQSILRSDKTAHFRIVTAKRMESRQSDDVTPLVQDKLQLPCFQRGANLGLFDHVLCQTFGASSLVLDAPFVYHELNGRYNRTGRCDMLAVGTPFYQLGELLLLYTPSGFKGFGPACLSLNTP